MSRASLRAAHFAAARHRSQASSSASSRYLRRLMRMGFGNPRAGHDPSAIASLLNAVALAYLRVGQITLRGLSRLAAAFVRSCCCQEHTWLRSRRLANPLSQGGLRSERFGVSTLGNFGRRAFRKCSDPSSFRTSATNEQAEGLAVAGFRVRLRPYLAINTATSLADSTGPAKSDHPGPTRARFWPRPRPPVWYYSVSAK